MRKKRHTGHCSKCGTWRFSLHRDHIIPRWKGGSDDEFNIQYICANCHEDKTRDDLKGHQFTKGMKYTKRGPAYVCTDDHKRRISTALTGHPVSEETRRKISEAKTKTRC